jgi:hypothetical protein
VDLLARTFDDGIAALRLMGPWDVLYLDHDLCAVRSCFSDTGREMTGYDVVCFLEANPEFLPKRVVLVTANPVGRTKMVEVLKKFYGSEYNGS